VFAYHYGVPQRRRRLILIASHLGPIEFPSSTYGPNTKHPRLPTVWERIGGLPSIKAGEIHPSVPNHRAANLSKLNLMRIAATPREGGRKNWPRKLRLQCHEDHSGHSDVYGRMAKHRPSTALTTRCISLSNGRFGHPTQNRAISLREAACIQTFPMSFEFHGTLNSVARQIGNAVPVELAHVFGAAITRHYRAIRKKKVL
jgi:DNA (cytosine-5)-methyltransferase 1